MFEFWYITFYTALIIIVINFVLTEYFVTRKMPEHSGANCWVYFFWHKIAISNCICISIDFPPFSSPPPTFHHFYINSKSNWHKKLPQNIPSFRRWVPMPMSPPPAAALWNNNNKCQRNAFWHVSLCWMFTPNLRGSFCSHSTPCRACYWPCCAVIGGASGLRCIQIWRCATFLAQIFQFWPYHFWHKFFKFWHFFSCCIATWCSCTCWAHSHITWWSCAMWSVCGTLFCQFFFLNGIFHLFPICIIAFIKNSKKFFLF